MHLTVHLLQGLLIWRAIGQGFSQRAQIAFSLGNKACE
jgi:hypothetical protein